MHSTFLGRVSGTPTPRGFRIDASVLGGTVHLDGIGEVDCLAYEVIGGQADRPTRLLLHIAGEGVIEGEGIVETIRDAPSGDQVRRLNPEAIRAAVTDKLSMGTSAAAAYRDVIADMLDQAGP